VLPGAFIIAVQVVRVPVPDGTYVTGLGEHDNEALGVALFTVKLNAGDVSDGALPLNAAVIECNPGASADVGNVATSLVILEVPSVVDPS
jgi:hypothetical protein